MSEQAIGFNCYGCAHLVMRFQYHRLLRRMFRFVCSKGHLVSHDPEQRMSAPATCTRDYQADWRVMEFYR